MKTKPDLHLKFTAEQRGYMIIETLVYGFLMLGLIGVAFAAFYRSVDASVRLRRSADDVSQALLAGEHWRSDIRTATGLIVMERDIENEILALGDSQSRICYRFASNAVWRRVGATPWVCALTNVHASAMSLERRGGVTGWRWELELQPRAKRLRSFRPMFTFLAVSGMGDAK